MTITLKQDDGISRLTLDDPTRRNTLTVSMLESMSEALDEVNSRHETSVLALRGSGDVFCAGIDLDACHASDENTVALLTGLSDVIRRLRRLPQVVVAGVQGAAIAGGSALLTGCDFCCVEADAKLGYPVTRVGLSAAVSVPTLVSKLGVAASRGLVLEGRVIKGREAVALGFADQLAESRSELEELTEDRCRNLAAKPPKALMTTKSWLNELESVEEDSTLDAALERSLDTARHSESSEMLEKNWIRKGN
tara:strand:+ start:128 stop:880 length:753 start_codon:yes stop_codon:yes gene_type:complete